MPNSIRTPSPGKTAFHARIAEAVDNQDWQEFRLSLKKFDTAGKIDKLKEYYERKVKVNQDCTCNSMHGDVRWHDWEIENIKIRVDNYLKALSRGGQLHKGVNLLEAIGNDWKLSIRK